MLKKNIHKILIASNNAHKISEIKKVVGKNSELKIFSLNDFGITLDVNEDGATLEENAYKKAKEIYEVLQIPTVSDDTGLFVDSLKGEPGIYSARYAGENASYKDNCDKLLSKLINIPKEKRTAVFKSVICFFINENEYYFFEGKCKGTIINSARGDQGFGYDPVFLPERFDKTFAEMTDDEKNKISHRARALEKFSASLLNG